MKATSLRSPKDRLQELFCVTRFGLQSDACLSHRTIVCVHYFTLKWASSAGGRRLGESFKGDRVSVWGDESLLEMGSGNDCTAMWRKHAVLPKVVKMVSLPSRVCAHALVAQSYRALCNPMDGSPPGSSIYGILQARILEWVNIPFSKGSSRPKDRTQTT